MSHYQRPRPSIEVLDQRTGKGVRTAGNDVLSLTVEKTISQPAGSWNVGLAPRSKYLTEVKNGDWVRLFLDESDKAHTVGIVQRVARNRVTSNKGATTETAQLSGMDVGAVLVKTTAVVDPFVGRLIEEARFQENFLLGYKQATLATGFNAPHEIAGLLVDRYLNERSQMVPPPTILQGFHFREERHGKSASEPTTRGHVINVNQPNLSGNLWQIFKTYCHEPLNEMWVDTEDGEPCFYIGERPFSRVAFSHLHHVEVDGLGWQENIGKSASDARNWFRVYAEGVGQEVSHAAETGYIVPKSISRHGLARMEIQTNAWADRNLLTNTSKADSGVLDEYAGLLCEWHWNAEEMVAGSITGPWRPDIRVGTRLDYRSNRTGERLAFYVEGVSHTFNFLRGMSSTRVELTRGVPFTEDGRLDYPTLKTLDELLFSEEVLPITQLRQLPSEARSDAPAGQVLV